MLAYFIVCPLVFLGGFMDSIAGGGGLISLPAYILAGFPAHIAVGTNKLSSIMGTTISTGRFLRNGYLKKEHVFTLAVPAVMASLLGSSLGSRLSLMMDEKILKNLLAVVLPVVALYVLRKKNTEETEEKLPEYRKLLAIVLAAAFVIGCYDGFYGPGTGTFLIIIFTSIAHMSVQESSVMTKLINWTSNAAALSTFLMNGTVMPRLGLCAGLFGILGNYLGSGLVVQNGQKIVRPVIVVVLVLLFIKVVSGL